MGHPDRRLKRERQKEKKRQLGLDKKNIMGQLDLTPYNAIKQMFDKKVNASLALHK